MLGIIINYCLLYTSFTNNSAKEGSAIYSGDNLNIDDDTTFTNNMVYMYYTGTLDVYKRQGSSCFATPFRSNNENRTNHL